MDNKLVEIEWLDSRRPVSEWQFIDEYQPQGVVRCKTVGFLIYEDETQKCIAQNVGNIDSKGDEQMSGIIEIPVTCIISLKELPISF